MSTRSTIYEEAWLDFFEETTEPQSIFGSFTGYNGYLTIEPPLLQGFTMQDEYITIKTNGQSQILPNTFKIWLGGVLSVDWDDDGLLMVIKGGSHVMKQLMDKKFDIDEKN